MHKIVFLIFFTKFTICRSICYRQVRNFWVIGPQIMVENHSWIYLFGFHRYHQKLCRSGARSLQYIGFNRKFSSRDLSRMAKLILYQTVIFPVFLYGLETWSLLSTDAAALRVFEGKVQQKIFGSVQSWRRFPYIRRTRW